MILIYEGSLFYIRNNKKKKCKHIQKKSKFFVTIEIQLEMVNDSLRHLFLLILR